MTHAFLNQSLWLLGLVLQAALLALLLRRGTARRFPVFTSILAFYILRSAALHLLSERLTAGEYGLLSEATALLDDLLQLLVAGEIAVYIVRRKAVQPGRAWGAAAAMLLLSVLAGWFLGRHLTLDPRIPLDRVQISLSCLMLLLFLWGLHRGASRFTLSIAAGFACFGLAGLLAALGRSFAFQHRDIHAYMLWSYLPASAYIAVVLFWLAAALHLHRPRSSDSGEAALVIVS